MHVLVTGATGFIGAHVLDCLLAEGIRVRGATRSLSKGREMQAARPGHAGSLDFVEIRDFGQDENQNGTGIFDEAIKGMDAVIHVASV
jgi:nucleoside-diphosphate-sugar epimerase